VAERGVDHDQFARNATRLAEKALAIVFLEVPVEEARQRTLEGGIREGKLERVSLDEPALWNLSPRELEHRCALVEPGDLAAKMLSEKTGSAGHVERPRGWQRLECAGESSGLLVPGPMAGRKQPRPAPPVVVLGRPPLVVGLHTVLDYARAFAARVGAEFLGGARPADARRARGRSLREGAVARYPRRRRPQPLRVHARRRRGRPAGGGGS